MTFYYRPQFWSDIEREQLYLLEHAGTEIAAAWVESLHATLAFLDTHPLAGRVRKDLKNPGVRSWRLEKFHRWLLFYSVRKNEVVIYRVVSGTMNLYALDFA